MKAKQVKKEKETVHDRLNPAVTTHRYFQVGEQVRLQSIDSEGNYETGRVVDLGTDHNGKLTHYQVALGSDPNKIIKVNVWFVAGMDSPERPVK